MRKQVAEKTYRVPASVSTYTARIFEMDNPCDATRNYQVIVKYDGFVIYPRHNPSAQSEGFILGDFPTFAEAYGAMLKTAEKRALKHLTPVMGYLYEDKI